VQLYSHTQIISRSRLINVKDATLGELYYQYGRALLTKAQCSGDIFGDKATKTVDQKSQAMFEAEQKEMAEQQSLMPPPPSKQSSSEAKSESTDHLVLVVANADEFIAEDSKTTERDSGEEDEMSEGDDEEEEEGTPKVYRAEARTGLTCYRCWTLESDDRETLAGLEPNAADSQEATTATKLAEATAEAQNTAADLELAWEALEFAREIFTDEGASKLNRLSDVHQLQGEIAMEAGTHRLSSPFEPHRVLTVGRIDNMPGAIEEFQKSIQIREKVEPKDNRALSEGYGLDLFALCEQNGLIDWLIDFLKKNRHFLLALAMDLNGSVKDEDEALAGKSDEAIAATVAQLEKAREYLETEKRTIFGDAAQKIELDALIKEINEKVRSKIKLHAVWI